MGRFFQLSLFLFLPVLGGCWVQGNVWGFADADSRAYVDKAVPAILRSWDVKTLDGMVRDGFYTQTSRKRVAIFFAAGKRKLGPLRSFTVAKSAEQVGLYTGLGSVKDARYQLDGAFKKGKGEIFIEVRKIHDEWKVFGIRVDSDAFFSS